eukprot:gene18085-12974_t
MADLVEKAEEIVPQADADVDVDSDEESEQSTADIQLGFAEAMERNLFLNTDWTQWDGGKIGGLPIWLDYHALPSVEDLQCPTCNEAMNFLLEVYSPLDTDIAFHRAVYVFCCRNAECVKTTRGFKCLRVQLPKVNPLYPTDPTQPADHAVSPKSIEDHLCALCGCRGKSLCSRCRNVRYCSKAHQKQHWKIHKAHCSAEASSSTTAKNDVRSLDASQRGYLFPEYEIVVDPEDVDAATLAKSSSEVTKEPAVAAETILSSVPKNVHVWDDAVTAGGEDEDLDRNLTQQDYNKALSEKKYDPVYINFLTRIDRGGAQQVLRYVASSAHRTGVAPSSSSSIGEVTLDVQERGRLYVSRQAQKEVSRVPLCPHCGGARALEFQIMPQILHFLGVDRNTQVNTHEETAEDAEGKAPKTSRTIENRKHDDLDWGTIDVYTCIASCTGGVADVTAETFQPTS